MRGWSVLVLVLLLTACSRQEPDYFPLVEGARRYMRVHTRVVKGVDTTETTEVRLVTVVHGEKDVPGIGRAWVVETPRESGQTMYNYFTREQDAVFQYLPAEGGKPIRARYLSLPLAKGKSWYSTDEQHELFEVVEQEAVVTEAGTFADCYKVAVVSTKLDWAMHEWLASGIGSVKWESRAAWTEDSAEAVLYRSAELVRYELPGQVQQ